MTILDFVQHSTATTGNGATITLGTSTAGFQSFANAGAANNTIYSYGILDTLNTWEVGQGTYITNATGNYVLRTVVNYSSNTPNSMISLSGSALVYATMTQHDYDTFTPANSIFIGNTTANSSANSTVDTFANSTGQTVFTPVTLLVGNTTANYIGVNSTSGTFVQNATANSFCLPGTATWGNTTANVSVWGLTAQTNYQNATANTFEAPGQGTWGNSIANVHITGLTAQVNCINATANTLISPGTIVLKGAGSNTITMGANSQLANNSATVGANGYTFIPNGFLLQWIANTANNTAVQKTWPVAFPNHFVAAFISTYGANSVANGGATYDPWVITANTGGANVATGNGNSTGIYLLGIGW